MSLQSLADLGENYSNVPMLVIRYEEALDEAKRNIELKGKTLKQANLEHPAWYVYYDERRVELSVLCSILEAEVAKVRSKLLKKYEQYPKDLSDRQKEKYIDHEQAYLDVNRMYLIVVELRDKYASIVEGFRARGFALRNLVDLAVNELNERVI